ncbi:sulfurtransferase [Flavobacterium soyangense]|uniref:Sulfurtransferase n=1 Tax=Flavobacterium soyangense TaxID=2023265 RepID=A0A930XV11_9FLAO|nr:sulfurtransferase [Flavobacterium soyangense]MBF2707612.1 sulfurtransferase [Flavobacterium soyangense]
MTINISPIIQAQELLTLYKSENLIIVDVSNGKNAKLNYEAKHLEGAIFIDLNTQLAEINDDLSIGGRHPLPKIENFAKTVSNLGISPKSHIIIYDDKNGSNASARFWWMLKSIGHEKVQVLNGGIQEAEKNNFPISSKTEIINKTETYKVTNWKLKIAEIEEVEKVSQNENHIVIDVRDAERYNGEIEPIDLIAGHIPGAINVPFTENLDENGLFLSPNLLKEKYEKIFGNVEAENIIVHCGSGVTACHSLLAIAYAGLEIPKLYVGSWSEWSRNNKAIHANRTDLQSMPALTPQLLIVTKTNKKQ